MLSEIRIKQGQPISFNVNVEGEPNPKCQWLLNGSNLSNGDRTKIDNSLDNNTKLKTKDAERGDSGRYTLIATNEHGKDEAEVNVVVLGKFIRIKYLFIYKETYLQTCLVSRKVHWMLRM